MILRNSYKKLLQWKDSENRKPLLIRGARQVGKTTLVRQFSKEFSVYLELNLEKESDKKLFEFDETNKILNAIYLSKGVVPEKGKTLLFIDEIQESPKAISQLRYFFEEHEDIHVIAAGSLLEFALSKVPNFPVGRVDYLVVDYKKRPRLQFVDTGLWNQAMGLQASMIQVEDLDDVHRGRVIQHFVAQEINSTLENKDSVSHFWVRQEKDSNSEVDIIFPFGKFLIPVEVKSGSSGYLRSLHQFIDRCNHSVAVRFYAGKFEIENTKTISGKPFYLINLPYYLGTQLEFYLEYFFQTYNI